MKKSTNAPVEEKKTTQAQPLPEIRFYRANERPYGVFSNLYRCEVRFENQVFPTAEHAYQAGKAAKSDVRQWILNAPTPALAAMAAHGLYTWDVVPNWAQMSAKSEEFDLTRGPISHETGLTLGQGTSASMEEAGESFYKFELNHACKANLHLLR